MDNKVKGLIAIASAMMLQAFSVIYVVPLAARTSPKPNLAERVVLFLFDRIGTDEIVIGLWIAGGIYLVGADVLQSTFGTKLEKGLENLNQRISNGLKDMSSTLAVGVSDPSKELVIKMLGQLNGDRSSLRDIARVAYARYYGQSTPSHDYCTSVEEILFDHALTPGHSYREGANTTISVRKSDAPDGMMLVEERNNFTLISNISEGEFEYPLNIGTRFRIDRDGIIEMLRQCAYTVTVDSKTVLALPPIRQDYTIEKFEAEGFGSEDGAVMVTYDGTHLNIRGKKSILIKSPTTEVRIYEKSFTSIDDEYYALTYKEAVKGFDFKLQVEAKHSVLDSVVVGPKNYWRDDSVLEYAFQDGWPDKKKLHFVDLSVKKWVLPGLVLSAHWRRAG